MKLETAFEEIGSEDLHGSMEYWDEQKIEEHREDSHISDNMIEAFVHPRTGTAARIMVSGDTYSVQPTMGGFADYDCVIQPDEPGTYHSGPSSVAALEIETLSEARAVAFYWLRGWIQRNGTIDNVKDSERHEIPRTT